MPLSSALDRTLRGAARVVATAGCTAVAACGGAGWIADHPDVAARARANPGAFVEPTYERWTGIHSLSGAYQLRASRGIGSRTFDLAVSVQRPDRVDISVLDQTGAIQAYLRANPYEVGLFVAEDRVLYRGPATRAAFERALGLDLSASDAVAVFLGYGVDPEGVPVPTTVWDEQERRVRSDFGTRTSLWLHPVQQLFDRVAHRSAGGTLTAEMREWMPVAPETAEGSGPATYPVPSLTEVEVEPDGFGLRLRLLSEPRLNHDLPPSIFELQSPSGTLELPLEELARQGGLFQRTQPEEQ